jgi:predicted RNase H-like HicB family nuclease
MCIVARFTKTLDAILRRGADANIRFADWCGLLANLGFTERIRGDHHIFTRDGVSEIINIQPRGARRNRPPAHYRLWRSKMADRRLKRSRTRPAARSDGNRTGLKTRIRYEIILYWSKPDGAFVAEVPELPGCAADGKTYREALANAEVVIKEWLETARELGRPMPKPGGRLT